MFTDEQLAKMLPFNTPRHEQIQALRHIEETWRSGKSTVILDLPTGVGKSGVAIAASEMSTKIPFQGQRYEERTWLVTTQRTLQKQYVDDFGDDIIANLSSKSNYSCMAVHNESCTFGYRLAKKVRGKSLCDYKASLPSGERGKAMRERIEKIMALGFDTLPCGKTQSCPYSKAYDAWVNSPIALTNFAYFMNYTKRGVANCKRHLVVVDEAHAMEDEIVRQYEVELSEEFLKKEAQIAPPMTDDLDLLREWIGQRLIPRLMEKVKKIEAQIDIDSIHGKDTKGHEAMYQRVKNYLEKALVFHNQEEEQQSNWVVDTSNKGSCVIKPLHISGFGQASIMQLGDRHIFMSGTILDREQFCNVIGARKHQATYLSVPSPFDPDNRMVMVRPKGSMGRKQYDNTMPRIMKDMQELLLDRHADDKGIIHTGSYKIAQHIQQSIKDPKLKKRLLFHKDAREREGIMNTHFTSDEPTILVSPSMTTGVDLRGRFGIFGMIVKVPWPYLGDARVKKLFEEDKGWYSWKTVQEIMQACGRVTRSKDDDSVTYIFDGDFERLLRDAMHLFPEWWLNGLVR